jgi:hypothetical protein
VEKVKVKLALFGLVLCFLTIVFSCSEGDFTIFYQVVNEQMIKDSDLENKLTVMGMVNAGGRYYIAAGKIFTRGVDSDNWDSVSNQNLQNGENMCDSMALFGSYLYASFYAKDGKSFGLYYVNPVPSPNTFTWYELTGDADIANKQANDLKVVNGNLFVSVENNNGTYSLAYTNDNDPTDGQNYDLITFDASDTISTNIRDLDWDGVHYWYLTGEKIYQATPGPSGATEYAGGPTISDSERYEGIVCTDENNIYISTSKGNIWFYNGSWTSKHFKYVAGDGSDENVWFTKFLQVPGAATVDMIVVGTRGVGFYEINEDLGLDDINRFANTSKSELYRGSVELFFNNSNTLFVLTAGTGLWRSNLQTDGSWGRWTWE